MRSAWLIGCLTGSLLAVLASTSDAYVGTAIDDGARQDIRAALGIDDTFGRWNTPTVKLVYDPDGAPSQFDSNKMRTLIIQATAQWEKVCGIKFELLPNDANAPDDRDWSIDQRDGQVRIYWAKSTGFAGLAGPVFGHYDMNLGYYPYTDGDVKLNDNPQSWTGDQEMINTLTHEFGHLIGLGHSDSPLSIMYANPYNFLNYPREDDIRAAQALYGVGSGNVDPAKGVSDWRYTIPPAAAASVTQYLFKPNSYPGSKAAFMFLDSAQSTAITALTDATANGQYLWLNAGGVGSASSSQAINVNATLVVIDPDGYQWDKFSWNLKCNAGSSCYGAAMTIGTTTVLKTYPGNWKILVVDEAANTLLLSQTLAVTTTAAVNQAPTASVSYVQGATSAQVAFTLKTADAEKNKVTVIWHPPGKLGDKNGDGYLDTDIRQQPGSDGAVQQTIDFSIAGTYTMFVELKDDSVRYGQGTGSGSAAGDGFSNLLRLTVNLPLSGIAGGVTVLAQHPAADSGTTTPGTPILVSQAKTLSSTSTSGTTSAAFTAGASKDNGLTTATTFKSGDSVSISGAVQAQAADQGKAANLYVVVVVFNTWFYQDVSGNFKPWDGVVASLQPAMQTSSLQASTTLNVYKGPVPAGSIQVFLGYKLQSGATLHYTNSPLQLSVN